MIAFLILLILFCYILFENSDDQRLPLLEHDELDALLNGIDWEQPLSPLEINLPTDPDIINLHSSASSPISPVVLPDEPPNPLVHNFLQSLTNIPIHFTDHPTTSQQESRVNILLPSLFGSKAHSNKTQSEESQSNPSMSRRLPSTLTALGTSTRRQSIPFTTKSISAKSANFQTETKRKSLSASQICPKASIQPLFTLPAN